MAEVAESPFLKPIALKFEFEQTFTEHPDEIGRKIGRCKAPHSHKFSQYETISRSADFGSKFFRSYLKIPNIEKIAFSQSTTTIMNV